MFSIRTIAIIGALVMVTTTAAHAGSKDRQAQRSKAKQREQERARKEKEAEEEKQREEEEAAEKEAQEKEAREQAKRDKEKARKEKEKAEEEVKEQEDKAKTEQPAAAGGSGEAFHDGTLGFSIPFTVIGAAAGAAAGEPVPTVDIVYFLGDTSALDLIVGLNFHRKHAVDAMGNGADSNLIGVAAGLGYRMYSSKNNLRSFIEPQATLSWGDISSTSALGVNAGVSLGVERNVTPWFSVSAQVGAAINFASSFQDIQLATTARLAANLYWH